MQCIKRTWRDLKVSQKEGVYSNNHIHQTLLLLIKKTSNNEQTKKGVLLPLSRQTPESEVQESVTNDFELRVANVAVLREIFEQCWPRINNCDQGVPRA